MKKQLVNLILLILLSAKTFGQYSGSFVVQGTSDKYYPVIFQDLMWYSNKATEFEIGRSDVHDDASWRGSLISRFRIHTNNWGNGSMFIDADVRQYMNSFIADWTARPPITETRWSLFGLKEVQIPTIFIHRQI